MDVLAAVSDLIGNAWVLAKDVGKGGGGSTDEPTVCMSLLPIGLAVALVGMQSLRRRLREISSARRQPA